MKGESGSEPGEGRSRGGRGVLAAVSSVIHTLPSAVEQHGLWMGSSLSLPYCSALKSSENSECPA